MDCDTGNFNGRGYRWWFVIKITIVCHQNHRCIQSWPSLPRTEYVRWEREHDAYYPRDTYRYISLSLGIVIIPATHIGGLGEITRTHAHSPRILRAFSAHFPRARSARRMRGEYAENTRRMRGEYASALRVLSAYFPRILRALKN